MTNVHEITPGVTAAAEETQGEHRVEDHVPDPPRWLSKQGKANWRYLAAELEKKALLTKRDRDSLALACEDAAIAQAALMELRPKDAKGKHAKNYELFDFDKSHDNRLRRHPALLVYSEHRNSFRRWCKEFGLTPLGRLGVLAESGMGAPASSAREDDEDDDNFQVSDAG